MSSGHGGEFGRWMVSYADFLTLLFVLFVILYSMGQTDLEKYKEMAQSFEKAFSIGGGGPTRVVDPQINRLGNNDEESEPAPIVIEGIPRQTSTGMDVADELTQMLSQSELANEVSIQNNIEGVLISVSEKLLFKSGTAELHTDAYEVLDVLVEMLLPLENEIKIVGHTDNTPPLDELIPDNWVLSTLRAYTIVEYFVSNGIDPTRLVAAGRGEYQPIFPNDTPEHKELNSRAEIIVIYPQDVQDLIQLDLSAP